MPNPPAKRNRNGVKVLDRKLMEDHHRRADMMPGYVGPVTSCRTAEDGWCSQEKFPGHIVGDQRSMAGKTWKRQPRPVGVPADAPHPSHPQQERVVSPVPRRAAAPSPSPPRSTRFHHLKAAQERRSAAVAPHRPPLNALAANRSYRTVHPENHGRCEPGGSRI